MGISPKDFLNRYFSPDQLKEALLNIGAPVGRTKKERIQRIIDNWQSYNRDWYELLGFLDWGTLAKICDDFGIPYNDYNTEETLCNKIEDERVLDFRKETMRKVEKKSTIDTEEKTDSYAEILKHLKRGTKLTIIGIIVAIVISVPAYFIINPNQNLVNEINLPEESKIDSNIRDIRVTELPKNKLEKYGLIIEFYVQGTQTHGADLAVKLSQPFDSMKIWFGKPEINTLPNQLPPTNVFFNVYQDTGSDYYVTTFSDPSITQSKSFYLYFESSVPLKLTDWHFNEYNFE